MTSPEDPDEPTVASGRPERPPEQPARVGQPLARPGGQPAGPPPPSSASPPAIPRPGPDPEPAPPPPPVPGEMALSPAGTVHPPGAEPTIVGGPPLSTEPTAVLDRPTAVVQVSPDRTATFETPVLTGPTRPAGERLLVHVVWEIVLLVLVGGAVALILTRDRHALDHRQLSQLAGLAASVGVTAIGFALSLRALAPNLGVLTLAPAAGGFTGWLMTRHSMGGLAAAGIVLGAAAVGGLLAGVLVAAFRMPAWAATLGLAWLAWGLVNLHVRAGLVPLDDRTLSEVAGKRWIWFAAFVVVSVGGGLLGTRQGVRARLTTGDDLGTRGTRVPAVALALGVSSLLAGLGGVLYYAHLAGAETATQPVQFGPLVIAAVLLGGTSVHGRRGGIAGTALAVCLLVLLMYYVQVRRWETWWVYVLAGAAALIGLAVSRLVEALGEVRVER
jgi:ribose/xylose/arabinose/galactoside ABC-type transport system permease subunit